MPLQLAEWKDFFIAAASASGALAGLVIVALSVNLEPILEHLHLPARAATSIATLILVLVTSMAALMPQSVRALGAEILVISIVTWALQWWSTRQDIEAEKRYNRPRWQTMFMAIAGQTQTLPFIVGSVLLLMTGNGLYWFGIGSLLIFIFSVQNAWVLLIEIRR